VKIHKTFGEQLRQLRESEELSLRQLAEKLEIDPSLLAKIERDQRPPTKVLIKKVADFFQVNERLLLEEFLSDQIAYKILDEDADLQILKVAEEKVAYLKMRRNE
jgi:transcriptional regulator with XRE-family HTH domain